MQVVLLAKSLVIGMTKNELIDNLGTHFAAGTHAEVSCGNAVADTASCAGEVIGMTVNESIDSLGTDITVGALDDVSCGNAIAPVSPGDDIGMTENVLINNLGTGLAADPGDDAPQSHTDQPRRKKQEEQEWICESFGHSGA